MFRSVLLVCTGNICRSPYAEAVFKKHLDGIDVGSAGLAALVDHVADSTATSVALARGIDLSPHRGKQITRALVGQSELILVMDDEHLQRLHKRYPESRGKSFKLAKLLGNKNIVDPHLKSQSFFELVFDEIDAAAAAWIPHFK
jgi:protein-tyrosine phosphatase